jgi:hypothetical protein
VIGAALDRYADVVGAADMNSVLGKVLLILDAFTVEHDELSLADLVRRAGMAR